MISALRVYYNSLRYNKAIGSKGSYITFRVDGDVWIIAKNKETSVLWNAVDMNNFYFLFLLFSDFIGILFSFSFSFLLDDEEACDTAVT